VGKKKFSHFRPTPSKILEKFPRGHPLEKIVPITMLMIQGLVVSAYFQENLWSHFSR